jgi:hypothetical protein
LSDKTATLLEKSFDKILPMNQASITISHRMSVELSTFSRNNN